MKPQKPSKNYAWVIMLAVSILFLVWTIPLLLLSGGQAILEQGLKLAGSPFAVGDLDEAALGYMNMSMLKPLWEEIWIGVLGIYVAISLKQNKRHAWALGLMWGIMLITNAAIQGVYEVIMLDWSSACLQTYLFFVIGTTAVGSLLIARKGFFGYQPER
ncbi:MAG: hypothetical protein P8Z00_07965 [Anaerolineales bacterium]|jgi:hypothetical protein